MSSKKMSLCITFSQFCMDCAQVNNVSLEEMVNCLTYGTVTRLNGSNLSFRYRSIEVITCSKAQVAMSVIRHKNKVSSLLYKSSEQMSSYECAMVA